MIGYTSTLPCRLVNGFSYQNQHQRSARLNQLSARPSDNCSWSAFRSAYNKLISDVKGDLPQWWLGRYMLFRTEWPGALTITHKWAPRGRRRYLQELRIDLCPR